ncbi:MAG: glycoside hydrolase family 3 C-terminal domain-containing protein [bacterium]
MRTIQSRYVPQKRVIAGGFLMLALLVPSIISLISIEIAVSADMPLYKNTEAPVEQRVEDLLGRMTLEEKINMVSGDPATGFSTLPNERLGIPKFTMSDGPHGVRWGISTCFPTSVTMASTWNEALIEQVGVALGREALAKGRNVLLGPCINIHRVPMGGRNFESFAEDPYLVSRMAVNYIKGVQSQGVVATPKHYAANNQEKERGTISVEIDDRTLREIYLPHFKAAITEAGAWSIMAAYNRVNGTYNAEHKYLLTDILKGEWGFKGFAMSDWGAVHSTVETALSGLDLEMPTGAYTSDKLLKAVKDGQAPESVVDDKVRRILRAMITTGLFDGKIKIDKKWENSPEHRATALEVAREGIVLLKNEGGVLPLDRSKVHSIAVIGPNANIGRAGGGGSSYVTSLPIISPLDGIRKAAGSKVDVRFAMGCDIQLSVDFENIPSEHLSPTGGKEGEHGLLAEYFTGVNLEGAPVVSRVEKDIFYSWGASEPVPGLTHENFSARWSGTLIPPISGTYKLSIVSNGVSYLFINDKLKINNWVYGESGGKSVSMELEAGKPYKIRFEYLGTGGRAQAKIGWMLPGQNSITGATKIAAESDVAVVFAGIDSSIEGEGHDRTDIELPGLQNDLIEAVTAANPKTIVVLINGTPLIMKHWIDKVPAIVEAWYPGQEGGRAIAEILFGDVNPSGKLPVTLPNSWEESPAYGNYPGVDGKVYYKEGIFVGYRYYDKNDIKPVYPFGHGLSYTTFDYTDLNITPDKMGSDQETVEVSLEVKNTGKRAGKEVVQLYVRDVQASVERPVRELKGFRKIQLEPGESKRVVFEIDRTALSFYDVNKRQWVAEPGEFDIQIGSSSRDTRLSMIFRLE